VLTSTPTSDHTNAVHANPGLRYLAPGWFTRRVFNPLVARLTELGVSLAGSRVLTVRGRRSGEPRSTVVNVLTLDGRRYLVAPRGQAQWVRNLRAAGTATLRVGRRVETVTAVELADDDAAKLAVLRAYLERWKWEVGQFFDDLDHRSTDEALRAAAPGFPAFRLAQN
jgi:deazaflavin-dependent oxidoreductase (nitroreductase family)